MSNIEVGRLKEQASYFSLKFPSWASKSKPMITWTNITEVFILTLKFNFQKWLAVRRKLTPNPVSLRIKTVQISN